MLLLDVLSRLSMGFERLHADGLMYRSGGASAASSRLEEGKRRKEQWRGGEMRCEEKSIIYGGTGMQVSERAGEHAEGNMQKARSDSGGEQAGDEQIG